MPTRLRAAALSAALAICALALPGAMHAQGNDIIRGRVTGPDSLPLEGVQVTATSLAGNVNRSAKTNKDGRYTIAFPGDDGDYMMSFAILGYAARRFEVKRVAEEDILIADVRLQRVNTVLDAVEVVGERQRPRRNDNTPDASGTERTIATSEVPANLMGDLAAMAATLPGVQAATNEDGSNGFSVLGLGADQNSTTLNGMAFGGSNLPRDAAVSTSLVTSPYDVSRGGFSGAQFNIRTRPGSNFISRTGSFNFDSPSMQWADAAARALGQEYTNASLGGLLSGPLVYDKTFYNVSYQLGRRSNDFQTLLTTDAVGLKAAGVNQDSVKNTFLPALLAQGIPLATRRLQNDRVGDNGVLFGSIDLTSPSATSGRAVNISFNGGWGKQTPATGSATETPGYGGDRTNWRFGVQGRHSNFFGIGILTETSLGVNSSLNYGSPYLDLPAGRVRTTSSFPDGSSSVATLNFGGNPGLDTRIGSTSLGFQNTLSWFSKNNKHRLKLASELRHDNANQELAINNLGTFTYNSLADLQNNTPTSFTRSLSPRKRDINELVGGISLGDSYRRTDNLQITYGVRVDGARYLNTPLLNRSLDTLYGLHNDNIPNKVYFSPRMGFSWSYGTAQQIAQFFGAQRGPRAIVRGGIGIFQNLPGTNLIGSALDNTGLPSAVQQVTCVGSATPVPNWASYSNPANIPSACVGPSTPFANTSPNVTAFADDYASPRSLRSNINWAGSTLGNRLSTSVDLTYSLNLDQSSFVDRNFKATQQFSLPDEAARPVYVQSTSIVPATGAIASQDARVSQRYSRVMENKSDLKSDSYQFTLRFAPVRFSSSFSWSAWYTFTQVREQFRGFSSTVNNPLGVEWGRSNSSPHSIGYSLAYNFFDFLRVSWFGQFRSGMRYTPMVAGDINGDGYSNDRAYVYSPTSTAATADPTLGAGIQALLANGSAGAKSCLSSQLGKLADRNSCEGPWTSTATMSFSFNPIKVHMPQRATISFQLSNPLGAADLAMHGSNNLRGWGQAPLPDNQLLYVRGFDAATSRYKYEVNRRFGATNPAFNQFRAPVTLTALVRVDVGPTRERQMLTQQLDRGRRTQGTKAPEVMLRAMFGNGGIVNPLASLLRDQDTLHLTSVQADSIATMNRQYIIKLDGIWSPLIRQFAALPDDYDQDAVYHRYILARRQTVDLLKDLSPKVKALLTDDQYRKIPTLVASFLDTRYLASIRSGTAGLGTGGGLGFFPAGAEAFAGGGGGNVRVEIRQ